MGEEQLSLRSHIFEPPRLVQVIIMPTSDVVLLKRTGPVLKVFKHF